ncbi:MAG: DNA polymerase/3'-5' exonuclease PolX [Natronomonas sp.]
MSRNAEIAAVLEEFADHLEARDVEYKPNSYRRAADSVRAHTVAIETLAKRGGADAVAEIDDVGDAISSKIVEYLETGAVEELEELRAELPVDMDALTAVEGVGPKTVADLYDELDVRTLDDLEDAAEAGEIQKLYGYGPKTETNIREAIPFAREARNRSLLGDARPIADAVLSTLAEHPAVERAETAGSIRRWRPTIGDVDVLVGTDDPEAAVDALVSWDGTDDVIEAGTGKASVRCEGFRVDLRAVDDSEFGAALQYFTGSKAHNVTVRNRAIDRALKLNEYGVFDVSDLEDDTDQRAGVRAAGETETGVYEALGMAWVPPELREDRGEVEAAAEDDLPTLLERAEIRGDLHLHTNYSDGRNTIAEMATAAADFGHEYIAITDHATGPGMVGGVGLTDEELTEQIEAVRAADDEVPIDLFAGVEANIDAEGGVSVGDDVLSELDLVVASPHSGLDGDGTDRIVTAIEHPEVNVIGHPTGRRLNQRPGHDLDFEAVAEAAAEHDTALEINADPHRLDLHGAAVQIAVDAGATIAIDTDAHHPDSYEYMRYGVHTARRGWAGPEDVLNCRPADGVRSFLK